MTKEPSQPNDEYLITVEVNAHNCSVREEFRAYVNEWGEICFSARPLIDFIILTMSPRAEAITQRIRKDRRREDYLNLKAEFEGGD